MLRHANQGWAVLGCALFLLACGDEAVAPAAPEARGRPSAPVAPPPPPEGPAGLIPAFPELPDLRFPVAMVLDPDDASRWIVLEQEGRVRAFPNRGDARALETLLDLSPRVLGPKHDWESGLLGIAFHPDFARTRAVFLFYVTPSKAQSEGGRSVLARFRVDDDGRRIDPASERVLLEIEGAHPSYNAGSLVFGPDGFLYVSSGQNAPSEARPHPSPDPTRLEGKILRLDVDGGEPYAIPPGNPYAQGGGAPEVYASGLRNPWKIAFDPETGRLFAGEVGQHGAEEVLLIEAGRDYGWPEFEGDTCHSECPARYAPPIHAYAGPGAAIVGGVVYRGARIRELRGAYLFGDFMRSELWALHPDGEAWDARRLLRTGKSLKGRGVVGSVTAFATDTEGEVFVLTRGGRIGSLVTKGEARAYYLGR